MANTIKIDSYPAEDKGSPEDTQVSGKDGLPLTKHVKSIQLETFNAGTAEESNRISIELAGNSDQERKSNAQHAHALLTEAGFKKIETKALGTHMAVVIDNAGGKDALMNVAHALGRDLDGARGEVTYALLDSKVIHAIERHYLRTTGLKPSEAGLLSISTEVRDAERHALYGTSGQHIAMVDVTLPHGIIAAIREDALPASTDGVNTVEMRTDVTLRDRASQNKVMEALNACGLKATLFTDKDVAYVRVETTADQVALALAPTEILSSHVAEEIASHAVAAHPDPKVSFVARVARGQNVVTPLPDAAARR